MAEKLSSPMKLMWSRNREETLEEINRKMQRALEEALMKNIHLQQVGVSSCVYCTYCIGTARGSYAVVVIHIL